MALPGGGLIRLARRAPPVSDPGGDAPSPAEIMAAMATAVLVIGGCAPSMILGWTKRDPDE